MRDSGHDGGARAARRGAAGGAVAASGGGFRPRRCRLRALLLGGLTIAAAGVAAPSPSTTNSVPHFVVQELLDRVHSNAVNRLRADFEIERLLAERGRLEAERDRLEADRKALRGNVQDLERRIATSAPPREVWAPGPFLVLVPATARGAGDATLELEPLQIVEVTARGGDNRFTFRSGSVEYEVPADRLATEAAVQAQLARREQMLAALVEQSRAARAADAEELATQLARVQLTRRMVREAFVRHRAGAAGSANEPPSSVHP